MLCLVCMYVCIDMRRSLGHNVATGIGINGCLVSAYQQRRGPILALPVDIDVRLYQQLAHRATVAVLGRNELWDDGVREAGAGWLVLRFDVEAGCGREQ